MQGWTLTPGIGLIAAGFLLQFGSLLRRPRDLALVRTGVRLRFIGFGLLWVGLGANAAIVGLLDGPDPLMLILAFFMLAMAGTWFYAATDRIFTVTKPDHPS